MKKPARIGETARAFAARLGVGEDRIKAAKARGLPLHTDGTVNTELADLWLKHNHLRKPGYGPPPDGYESLKAFCRRIGISGTGGARGLRARRIPIGPDGFLNIEEAITWIKYNGAPVARKRSTYTPPG